MWIYFLRAGCKGREEEEKRRAKMSTKTVLNRFNPIYVWGGFVPKMCPKKVSAMGLKLVPVAPGVC